ncbi:MAG: family 16 glycoside hydrolase [Candidatus Brocadiia bacterium]
MAVRKCTSLAKILLCLFFAVAIVAFADDDIARAFLGKGDEAAKKGDAKRALEFYQKAVTESANLPDAHFKIGEISVKTGERLKGRLALKKCIALIDQTGQLSASLKEIRKKAEDLLAGLEISQKEGKIIEQEYVKELLAFAKKVRVKDNFLAEEALKAVLIIDPQNTEALKIQAEIKANTFVPRWAVIFNGKDLGDWKPQSPDDWKIGADGELACDTRTAIVNTRNDVFLENNFIVSAEFKVSTTHDSKNGIGIVIGLQKGGSAGVKAVSIFDQRYIGVVDALITTQDQGLKWETLPAETYKPNEWNLMQIEVSGETVKVLLNEKPALEYKGPVRNMFNGGVGLWVQKCRVSFRNIKYQK